MAVRAIRTFQTLFEGQLRYFFVWLCMEWESLVEIIVFFFLHSFLFFAVCNCRFHFCSLAFQGVHKIYVRFLR